MTEILQQKLENLIRGKEDIKIEKFKRMCKSYLDIQQWKTKKKFVSEKKFRIGSGQTCRSFARI